MLHRAEPHRAQQNSSQDRRLQTVNRRLHPGATTWPCLTLCSSSSSSSSAVSSASIASPAALRQQ
eukprot:20148-Heterococcus_DN1.PRE.4